MLLSQISSRRLLLSVRSVPIFRNSRTSFLNGILRSNSTVSKATTTGKKFAYPERLLVYHAGTGKTVFIGCLKVTTIFIFSFFCLVIAPSHFFAENEPYGTLMAAGVIISGIVPMAFVAYTSRPFVSYVHLRIPPYARYSRDILLRYSKNLPKDASVDITTMNFIGKPRGSLVKVSELFPVRKRFGLVNYARDTSALNAKRPWWMGKAVGQFGITGVSSRIREAGVWENVVKSIEKSAGATSTKPNKVHKL